MQLPRLVRVEKVVRKPNGGGADTGMLPACIAVPVPLSSLACFSRTPLPIRLLHITFRLVQAGREVCPIVIREE